MINYSNHYQLLPVLRHFSRRHFLQRFFILKPTSQEPIPLHFNFSLINMKLTLKNKIMYYEIINLTNDRSAFLRKNALHDSQDIASKL